MWCQPKPVLIVVAAPLEGQAVCRAFGVAAPPPEWTVGHLSDQFRLLMTGVGKVNAAGAVARALERGRYRAAINIGIAGALSGASLSIGDVVLAGASVFVEEGIITPGGFQTCRQMGFPLGPFEGNAVPPEASLRDSLLPLVASMRGKVGPIATVSTCSGTDAAAAGVVDRTGAIAEAMEGAAVGQVVARFSDCWPRRRLGFAEVRVISNTTGDRGSQRWEIKRALGVLADLAAGLPGALAQRRGDGLPWAGR